MLFFELGPDEVSLIYVFRHLEPETFLEDCLYEIRIVTLSNKNLERSLIPINLQRDKKMISKVYSEQKLPEFLQLYVDWSLTP
jgi:hypothetical protein